VSLHIHQHVCDHHPQQAAALRPLIQAQQLHAAARCPIAALQRTRQRAQQGVISIRGQVAQVAKFGRGSCSFVCAGHHTRVLLHAHNYGTRAHWQFF
jgi:hypothetical protein